MVAHPELPPDHLRHPLARPRFSSKALRLGSSRQKLGQFGALLLAEAGRRPGRRLVPQAFHALFPGALHPLAYGPLRDPRGSAMCVCLQPRSFNSKARKRLPSRQLLAWLDNVFSIVEYIVPVSLDSYAEISKWA